MTNRRPPEPPVACTHTTGGSIVFIAVRLIKGAIVVRKILTVFFFANSDN
jgi:hypothetical protein